MRRYKFLQEKEVYEALNRLRDAFLAARDGTEVEKIIDGLLSFDEKMKIGRRIQVAEYLKQDYGEEEISSLLKVGKATIATVARKIEEFPECFGLLWTRRKKVESEYRDKSYRRVGSSLRVFKPRVYTGFERKDVKR